MAGFFALLYGAFMLGGSAINSSKIESERIDSKKKAVEDNRLTYLVRGEEYFTENDEPCITTHDYTNGHKIIKAVGGKHSGRILYDYDAFELKKEKDEISKACVNAQKENKKYMYYSLPINKYKPNGFTGIEIETGRKYYVYKYFEVPAYYLQYLEDEPTMVYEANGYRSVYKFQGECKEITKSEYTERIQH